MNLHRLLQERAELGQPVRLGLIGAGKFGSMYLAQARLTPGIHVVGIADLDVEKARDVCLRTGWPEDVLVFGETSKAINDGARAGKTDYSAW